MMDVNITHTITLIELLWTIPGALGILLSTRNFRAAALEFAAVRRSRGNGSDRAAMRRVTIDQLRTEIIRAAMQAAIVVAGALALEQPNPPSSAPWTPVRIAITVALLVIPWGLCVQSGLDRLQLRFLAATLKPSAD